MPNEERMTRAGLATPLMPAEEFGRYIARPENDVRFFELVRGKVIEKSR
jgi:hypothetical protein